MGKISTVTLENKIIKINKLVKLNHCLKCFRIGIFPSIAPRLSAGMKFVHEFKDLNQSHRHIHHFLIGGNQLIAHLHAHLQ
ncbi:Uncharacterised protein [Serratia plymuthica]|nr:Uncharacterised protein [Serratia plymuthica]